jgi:hypothetical protein
MKVADDRVDEPHSPQTARRDKTLKTQRPWQTRIMDSSNPVT